MSVTDYKGKGKGERGTGKGEPCLAWPREESVAQTVVVCYHRSGPDGEVWGAAKFEGDRGGEKGECRYRYRYLPACEDTLTLTNSHLSPCYTSVDDVLTGYVYSAPPPQDRTRPRSG